MANRDMKEIARIMVPKKEKDRLFTVKRILDKNFKAYNPGTSIVTIDTKKRLISVNVTDESRITPEYITKTLKNVEIKTTVEYKPKKTTVSSDKLIAQQDSELEQYISEVLEENTGLKAKYTDLEKQISEMTEICDAELKEKKEKISQLSQEKSDLEKKIEAYRKGKDTATKENVTLSLTDFIIKQATEEYKQEIHRSVEENPVIKKAIAECEKEIGKLIKEFDEINSIDEANEFVLKNIEETAPYKILHSRYEDAKKLFEIVNAYAKDSELITESITTAKAEQIEKKWNYLHEAHQNIRKKLADLSTIINDTLKGKQAEIEEKPAKKKEKKEYTGLDDIINTYKEIVKKAGMEGVKIAASPFVYLSKNIQDYRLLIPAIIIRRIGRNHVSRRDLMKYVEKEVPEVGKLDLSKPNIVDPIIQKLKTEKVIEKGDKRGTYKLNDKYLKKSMHQI